MSQNKKRPLWRIFDEKTACGHISSSLIKQARNRRGYFPLSIADKSLLIHACKTVSDILIVHHDIAISSSHLNFKNIFIDLARSRFVKKL